MDGCSPLMKGTRLKGWLSRSLTVVGLVGLLWIQLPEPASAGVWDRVKDIYELPGQVDQLKQEYQKVKESYNETLEQLEASRRLAEDYRKQQEQLLADNNRLMEQNQQLAQMVTELKHSEETRERQTNRLKTMAWTAFFLIIGYFAITRIARYVMRAQTK